MTNEGTTIIGDTASILSEEGAFIMLRCVCIIARKYHLLGN
jgi:hypothetical protein